MPAQEKAEHACVHPSASARATTQPRVHTAKDQGRVNRVTKKAAHLEFNPTPRNPFFKASHTLYLGSCPHEHANKQGPHQTGELPQQAII